MRKTDKDSKSNKSLNSHSHKEKELYLQHEVVISLVLLSFGDQRYAVGLIFVKSDYSSNVTRLMHTCYVPGCQHIQSW